MEDYKNTLLKILKDGYNVYSLVVNVSQSGLSRNIRFFIIHDNRIIDITYFFIKLKVAGGKASIGKIRECINVKGCGMNIPYHCIEWLSKELNINLIHREL
jgi:hypothetical protein